MTFRRRLSRFVLLASTALTLVYTLTMLVLGAIWTWAPERTWWLALSNIFAPFFFLPLLLIAPLALLLRSRSMSIMNMLLVLLFVAQFGKQLLHNQPQQARTPASSAAQSLRVATFNQLYSNTDIPATLAVIKAQESDVVALQELSLTMAAAIKADPELHARYPYHTLWPSDSWWGVGVLSRYQIVHEEKARGFNGQIMTLNVAGQQIHLVNIHPPAPTVDIRRMGDVPIVRDLPGLRRIPLVRTYITGRRNEQLQEVLDAIDRIDGPLIVAGDFNTADRDSMHAALATRMQDAYAETSWGFGQTFPNPRHPGQFPIPFALVRIDYVWSRNGITPLATRIVCDATGSDHCMLVADLEITS